jgi:hypothetical protein
MAEAEVFGNLRAAVRTRLSLIAERRELGWKWVFHGDRLRTDGLNRRRVDLKLRC